MGVKDLWGVLTPYSDRKPINILREKTVAIDLAGWVCESLNAVDYIVHPQQHLKNLFFRTCYLLWERVCPIFVLEGEAPQMKKDIMKKRNELQFRGVKPKTNKTNESTKTTTTRTDRTRFGYVLKQCEEMLHTMGIQCVKAPGEAEAYCAYLNQIGLVDGIISQDSDSIAYGAKRIYRNFSISAQGHASGSEGSIDLYDMEKISKECDIGQHKAIVMALICGCDYCPEGIEGAGRDGVLKLFTLYKEHEILERIRKWRTEEKEYIKLEQRINDKTVCDNCGHIGRKVQHTRKGCGMCNTEEGCNISKWKEERAALKVEVLLRRRALTSQDFPNEEIIEEFLKTPKSPLQLCMQWKQPNIIKFVQRISTLLQWAEIYSFQKFLPILTRWHVLESHKFASKIVLSPKDIIKKRTIKGINSLEVLWETQNDVIKNLIPKDQEEVFRMGDKNDGRTLWTTIEPYTFMERAYPEMVENFIRRTQKPKKPVKKTKNSTKNKKLHEEFLQLSLEDNHQIESIPTEKVLNAHIPRKKKPIQRKGLQLIDKFFKKTAKANSFAKDHDNNMAKIQCSTPITKSLPSDLESDMDSISFDYENIIDQIVSKNQPKLIVHGKRRLHYIQPFEENQTKSSNNVNKRNERSLGDDLDYVIQKRNEKLSLEKSILMTATKRPISMDDSFDVLVKMGWDKRKYLQIAKTTDHDMSVDLIDTEPNDAANCSFFQINPDTKEIADAFERYMEVNTSIY